MKLLAVGVDLDTILIAAFVGVSLASIYAFYLKSATSRFVKAMLEAGANSPETAKTPEELGYGKNAIIKTSLKPDAALRKALSESEERPGAYYIPPESAELTERRFSDKGATFWHVLMSIALFLVLFLICSWLIPILIDMY